MGRLPWSRGRQAGRIRVRRQAPDRLRFELGVGVFYSGDVREKEKEAEDPIAETP